MSHQSKAQYLVTKLKADRVGKQTAAQNYDAFQSSCCPMKSWQKCNVKSRKLAAHCMSPPRGGTAPCLVHLQFPRRNNYLRGTPQCGHLDNEGWCGSKASLYQSLQVGRHSMCLPIVWCTAHCLQPHH